MPQLVTRPSLRAGTGAAAMAVAVAIGLLLAVPAIVDAFTSPRTTVDAPADGSVIAPADLVDGRVLVRGQARHPKGVAHIELVVKNLDTGRYWNGDGWQQGFVRTEVAVRPAGATTVSWSYGLDADDLERGRYRVRAFARSVEGNGDSNGGDLVEFDWRPDLDRALYDTEILRPTAGQTVSGPVVVSGLARSTEGVAAVRVVVVNLDTGRYWNGDEWTPTFTRIEAAVDRPGGVEVGWTVALPDDVSPGRHRVRAWVRTSSGQNDPFGRGLVEFAVATAPTTTTTPPSTTVPSTVPSTTAPSTTAPSTTAPSTTGPSTTAPSTTVRPTTTARPTTTVAPTTSTTVQPDPCPNGDPDILVPCQGVLIGASGDFTNDDGSGRSKQEHFASRERQLGADFDIFHDFVQWNDLVGRTWPKPATHDLAADGRIPFTNWKSPTGHPRDWAAIADGDYDADIRAAADQFIRFGQPTFLTFYHEPEDNIRDASASNPALTQRYIDDYRAAFRHLHDMFEDRGADNVIWVWDMQGWLSGWEDYYTGGLYPGDDVVDWVGWNPYNWYGCVNHGSPTRWKSFTEVVAPFYDWLDEGGPDRPGLDKPLMLGEFGSEEYTGAEAGQQTKAEWLAEAGRVLPDRFPRLRAVVYFDTEGRRADGSVQFCRWGLDSSADALDAMADLLVDGRLREQW